MTHSFTTGRYSVRVGPETYTAIVNEGCIEVSCGFYDLDRCAPADLSKAVHSLLIGAVDFKTVLTNLRARCWEAEGKPFAIEGVRVRSRDFFYALGGATKNEAHAVGRIYVHNRPHLGLYRGPYTDSTFHSSRWTLVFGEAVSP